jgi:hypothetical protein
MEPLPGPMVQTSFIQLPPPTNIRFSSLWHFLLHLSQGTPDEGVVIT